MQSARSLSLILSLLFLTGAVPTALAGTCTVDATQTNQFIRGFGAASVWNAVANLSPWAQVLWADDTTNGHVGFSILRTRIDPTDTGSGAAWNNEAAPMTLARSVNPNILIWSTAWTPPAAYKGNNNVNGGGSNGALNSSATFTGAASGAANAADTGYAAYLTRYVQYIRNNYGVTLYAVSPQNEPDWDPTYEAAIWNSGQFHIFVPVLYNSFQSAGLTTKIMIPESLNDNLALAGPTMNDATTAPMIGIIGGHMYGAGPNNIANAGWSQLTTQEGWLTEISDGNITPDDHTMLSALEEGGWIHRSMTTGNKNAFMHWWIYSGSTASLIDNSNNTITKRPFVIGNYSKFVRPGFYRMGGNFASNTAGVSITAYKNTNNNSPTTIVIVAINGNNAATNQTFNLTGLNVTSVVPWVTDGTNDLVQKAAVAVAANSFTYSMPVSSVVSFVGVNNVGATATPTRTSTATPTRTASSTATRTSTSSPTGTPTSSPTSTSTRTATSSVTASATASRTNTPSSTSTGTRSSTPTASTTATPSPTLTASPSASPTMTATVTASATRTNTLTNTATSSSTASPTRTPSFTASATPTNSPVFSSTPTQTPTSSATASATGTATPSATASSTPTSSPTASVTPTLTASLTDTPSASPAMTATSTSTSSSTATGTPSSTASRTPTASLTPSPTSTATTTSTLTATSTVSSTATMTPIFTFTPTLTATRTSTSTPSSTAMGTATSTSTASTTATSSPSATASRTPTASATSSWTLTATPSATPTWTASSSMTPTASLTVTRTATVTPTWTLTSTGTATPIPTSNFTGTPTSVGNKDLVLYPNPAPGPAVEILPPAYPGVQDVHIVFFTTAFRKVLDIHRTAAGGTPIPVELKDAWGHPLANGLYYVVVSVDGRRYVTKLLIRG